MEVLNLDSPVVFSSPAFFSIQTNEPRKRRSRKRSFSDMEDSDDSERSRSQTPTKRRKSAEGYVIDKPRDYIYATPKPDTIHRYEDSEELRPEGKSTKPRKRKADFHCKENFESNKENQDVIDFGLDFKTPCGDRDRPIEPFSLDEDVEEDNELVPNNPLKTPFEEDLFDLNMWLDMDNSNEGHEFLRKQKEVLPQTRFEKDFASIASNLNFKRGRFENVKQISCQEVRDILMEETTKDYVVLDCRFDYEFFGGHLRGAVKCPTRQSIEDIFDKYEHVEKVKFILHCELSVCRAPRAADYLACLFDRYVGRKPMFYIMNGGYSRFWKLFQNDDKKIFGICGYEREDSHLISRSVSRSRANEGWNKVLLTECNDECIEIC